MTVLYVKVSVIKYNTCVYNIQIPCMYQCADQYRAVLYTLSQYYAGTCRPYGINEVSECTQGFLSTFDIEVVEGLTDLHLHSARQVLIPDMNFNCTGSITKWIFSARWVGKSPAFTELQVWRRVHDSGNVYIKVGATTIRANQSINDMYEYPVDPPLAFQEGDILGYFQPPKNISQLILYLVNSDITVTFHDNIDESRAATK